MKVAISSFYCLNLGSYHLSPRLLLSCFFLFPLSIVPYDPKLKEYQNTNLNSCSFPKQPVMNSQRLKGQAQTSSSAEQALHFLYQLIFLSPTLTLYHNDSLLQFSLYLDCEFLKDGNPVLFLLYLGCLAPGGYSVNLRQIIFIGLREAFLNSK